MSILEEKTTAEWAELCESQQQTIRDLEKQRLERGRDVQSMKSTVQGMSELMDEQQADFNKQMNAARTYMASLQVFKERWEILASECEVRSMHEAAALLQRNKTTVETLAKASRF
jgi:hypothetical protein